MSKIFPLVSIYDAHSEKELFIDPEVVTRAHNFALALEKVRLGAIGHVESKVVTTVLNTLHNGNIYAIGLSPAGNDVEHKKSFRLPNVSFPLIFTGRGAFGADVMALTSSHGIAILGSEEEALCGVLGCVGDRGIPVAVFTNENPNEVRAKINARYPHLIHTIIVSKDANQIVNELMSEMRKKHFDNL